MPATMQLPMNRPTLNLVGAGRVGQTLARQWHQAGIFTVQDVHTRNAASAHTACVQIGAGNPCPKLEALRKADFWMMVVPDAALEGCALALADHHTASENHDGPQRPTAFHCSGALASAVLAPLAAQGWSTASAHCLLSFTSVEVALSQFPGTPCALEGNPDATATLRHAFHAIGAQCFDLASDDKLLYHAAAVFATNFVPVLAATAEDLWTRTGMPPALIAHARATLLRNAAANIAAFGPKSALTGPAARGDTAAIARQHAAVAQWDSGAGDAYATLSALALRLAAQRPR